MAIVCSMLDVSISEYVNKCIEVIHVVDLTQGLTKSCFFGFIVATIGCMKGMYAERNAQGVGSSTTSAVVSAIFLIVVMDAVITALFGITTT
jgi:phospholipid/cholesterol/gamma-HCH transport system permease protein